MVNVQVGKLADPNEEIKTPAVYIARSDVILDYLAIDNMMAYNILRGDKTHSVMYKTAIMFECISDSYGSCETLLDAVAMTIVVTKKWLEKNFKIHFHQNPGIGAPEPYEAGPKLWKGFVQVPIEVQYSWKQGPKAPALEDISVPTQNY